MKRLIYSLVSKTVKVFSKNDIIGKKFNGNDKTLYYERAQYLAFLFQKRIKYEDDIQSKLNNYITEGSTVFDIGANIGQYSLPFSNLVGSSGKVYSFEPDYKNFAFLQFNVNINKCSNIICCNHAIGRNNSQQEFYRDTETGGRRGTFNKRYVGEKFKGFKEIVNLKSFDTIISKFGEPDFVKIDVEGFEVDVLDGLTVDLTNSTFLIEVRNQTKEKVFDYFDKKGYGCICVDDNDRVINKAEEIPGFANLIFQKPMAHN